jgi:hypothetical protein
LSFHHYKHQHHVWDCSRSFSRRTQVLASRSSCRILHEVSFRVHRHVRWFHWRGATVCFSILTCFSLVHVTDYRPTSSKCNVPTL